LLRKTDPDSEISYAYEKKKQKKTFITIICTVVSTKLKANSILYWYNDARPDLGRPVEGGGG